MYGHERPKKRDKNTTEKYRPTNSFQGEFSLRKNQKKEKEKKRTTTNHYSASLIVCKWDGIRVSSLGR